MRTEKSPVFARNANNQPAEEESSWPNTATGTTAVDATTPSSPTTALEPPERREEKMKEIDKNGKVTRLRKECQQPTCGGGVFMAQHSNRHYCGRCHDTLVADNSAGASGEKGGKKGKK